MSDAGIDTTGWTAVAGKAKTFLYLLRLELFTPLDDDDTMHGVVSEVMAVLTTLKSRRLVTDSRQPSGAPGQASAAHVLLLMSMAKGAKAKPIVRLLYGRVAQAAKTILGYTFGWQLYTSLGFETVVYQNDITKDEAIKRLLEVCLHHPRIVARAILHPGDG